MLALAFAMYQFSRSIYRELSPRVRRDDREPGAATGRRRALLEAAETTITRLAADPDFARPACSLFNEVRMHFLPADLPWVRAVVDRHVELSLEYRDSLPGESLEMSAYCRAFSRRGRPCEREPLPGSSYCPSHRDWEDAGSFAYEAPASAAA